MKKFIERALKVIEEEIIPETKKSVSGCLKKKLDVSFCSQQQIIQCFEKDTVNTSNKLMIKQ